MPTASAILGEPLISLVAVPTTPLHLLLYPETAAVTFILLLITSSATLLMMRMKNRKGRPLEKGLYCTCCYNTSGWHGRVFLGLLPKLAKQPAYIVIKEV
jgi:hypothetical protein